MYPTLIHASNHILSFLPIAINKCGDKKVCVELTDTNFSDFFIATDSLSSLFRIDDSTGRITTDALLNTFNETNINLWVEATDEGGKSARTVVRITVLR